MLLMMLHELQEVLLVKEVMLKQMKLQMLLQMLLRMLLGSRWMQEGWQLLRE